MVLNGVRKFLSLQLSPSAYPQLHIFSRKVVRVLVRYWRSHAVRIQVYFCLVYLFYNYFAEFY